MQNRENSRKICEVMKLRKRLFGGNFEFLAIFGLKSDIFQLKMTFTKNPLGKRCKLLCRLVVPIFSQYKPILPEKINFSLLFFCPKFRRKR